MHFTVDQAGRELIAEAIALARHAVPSGRTEDVLILALTEYVAWRKRQKFGLTSRPGRRRASSGSRRIPAEVRRAVWERDDGRCAFPGCRCRDHLHYDHIVPVAVGGLSTTGNVRLLCWKHNQHEAEQHFGRAFIQGRRERARRERAQARIARARHAAEDSAPLPTQPGHVSAGSQPQADTAGQPRPGFELDARPSLETSAWRQPPAADPADHARAAEFANKKRDVAGALAILGVKSKDEIARAVARCDAMPDAPLEIMLKEVLKASFYPRGTYKVAPAPRQPSAAGPESS